MSDVDLGFATVLVTSAAAVDIGALDSDASQPLDLLDLPGQRVPVIRTTR